MSVEIQDKSSFMQSAAFPRIIPFALFMAFIGMQEGLRFLQDKGLLALPENFHLWLYPVKTALVFLILYYYRRAYTEINWSELKNIGTTLLSSALGGIVFLLWISMTWSWGIFGTPQGFNPTELPENGARIFLIVSRIAGAAFVVPIMEELFWRSWLLRYIITPDVESVPIGRYTLPSFLIGTALFGLEHNLWLAGMVAGALYSLLLYRTKSITHCILAHGITNLLLGIYVLQTGRWEFW